MLHPERDHDLLAPHDLKHHVPECHQVETTDALRLISIDEAHDYLALHGIDPMDCTDEELRLMTWHNLVHDDHEVMLAPGDRPLMDRIRRAGQQNRGR